MKTLRAALLMALCSAIAFRKRPPKFKARFRMWRAPPYLERKLKPLRQGPAFLVKVRGGLDSEGRFVAYDYSARSCDYNHVGYNEPDTVLISQLMGSRRATPAAGSSATPSDMYAIPNRRMSGEVVSLPLVWETPLRTGNLRDPNGPQSTFAAESFIDETGGGGEDRSARIPDENAAGRHQR